MENYAHILVEKESNIAIITINRPEKLNALNNAVLQDLSDAIDSLFADTDCRCILLTGAGNKAFVAGADIEQMKSLSPVEGKEFSEFGQKVFLKIEQSSKPFIAVINGYAFGGGAELAWACHLRIASEDAIFGQPEINIGLMPGYGGTQRLQKLIPKAKAYQFLLTGDSFPANEALSLGAINAVFPKEILITEAKKVAFKIAKKSGAIVPFLMKAIQQPEGASLTGLQAESTYFGLCFGTEDFQEGTTAFMEKRKPEFKHK